MMETGLTQYWRTKYWPRKNRCTDVNNNSHKIEGFATPKMGVRIKNHS